MSKLPYLNLAICLLFVTVSSNCASQSTNMTTKQKMDETMTRITQLIGDASCTNDQQCASIPIGAKPCGGPWSYRAYSTKHTDSKKLKQWVLTYKVLNKKYNKESGLMSDCSMVIQAPVACINKVCKFK